MIVEKKRTKHKAPYTQVASWAEVLKQGLLSQQESKVITYLLQTSGGRSSRQIAHFTKIERTSITRTLRNLLDKAAIYVIKIDVCPDTGKKVQFYDLSYRDRLF